MAQPTPYTRQYSFIGYQAGNPSDPLPADKLDLELNAVKMTVDQILANLALIQRDDGELATDSVGYSQLDGVLISLGFERPTNWATGTVYKVDSAVFQNNKVYICLAEHTSGVFATDLAAGRWVESVDFTTVITDANTAAAASATSAAAALASQSAAAASAVAAAASAVAADASADSIAAGAHDWYGSTTGTNNYVVAALVGFTPAVKTDGMVVRCRVASSNTLANPTLNVGTHGAVTMLRHDGTVIGIGELLAGSLITCVYHAASDRYYWQGNANTGIFPTLGGANAFTGANTFAGTSTFNNTVTANNPIVAEGRLSINGNIAHQEQTLTDAATVAWDMSVAPSAAVTVGGNRTFGAPTNAVAGNRGTLRYIQDGTGQRTPTWNAAFEFVAIEDATPKMAAAAETIYEYLAITAGRILIWQVQKKELTFAPSNVANLAIDLRGFRNPHIIVDGLVPATDDVMLNLQYSTDGTNYQDFEQARSFGDPIGTTANLLSMPNINNRLSNVANEAGWNGSIRLYNAPSAAWTHGQVDGSYWESSAVIIRYILVGFAAATISPVTHVRFACSSGNFTAQRIAVRERV